MSTSPLIEDVPSESRLRGGALARVLALPAPSAARAVALPQGLGRLAVVAAELALVLALFRAFDLEASSGFGRLAPLLFGGFLIHAALPLRLRLPFFLALSVAAFWVLFGPAALVVVAIGLALIGICHLPLRLSLRVGLLAAVGLALAAARIGVGPLGLSPTMVLAMPVIGSIFMFRLLIYLYDLEHEKPADKAKTTVWGRLSYFFLLPNAAFLFFPTLDFQTFRRTYYDAEAAEVYQKGVLWMFRGATHLLLYRALYYYVVPGPAEVAGLWGVVGFVVGTYLLYLRVSGIFHLLAGILCLFGFNLPVTNNHYYLASGFNDLWRRINIYWKDMMMKLFYYPAFTWLRKRLKGPEATARAVALATAFVFVATWALHSYQWFWLLGAFPVKATDAIFWAVFGALVIYNSLLQLKKGRTASLGQKASAFSARRAAVHAAKVMGMFVLLSLMWSFWYSPTAADWFAVLGKASSSGLGDWALLALGVLAVFAVGVAVQYLQSRGWNWALGVHPPFWRSAAFTGLGALLLLGLGFEAPRGVLGGSASAFIGSLQVERLAAHDAEREDRGYYEDLLTTNSLTTQLGGVTTRRPPGWESLSAAGATREVDGLLRFELVPSSAFNVKLVPLTVNRWGMRDQDYTLEKPPGTFRIALLGASIPTGAGIPADEVFEAVVEERLNAELAGRGGYDRYEILNFAVSGYSVLQQVALLDKVLPFDPDAVLLVAHAVDPLRGYEQLEEAIFEGIPLPPYLEAIRQEAGVDADTAPVEADRRLKGYSFRILEESYREIVTAVRAAGARPIWVFVPRTETDKGLEAVEQDEAEMEAIITETARENGFLTLSIGDAYAGIEDYTELVIAPWDGHPNPAGHQLLADHLYEEFMEHREALGLMGAQEVAPAPAAAAQPASRL